MTGTDAGATLRYLDRLATNRVTSGLDRIRWICHALGDPQLGARTVHITGTNGKGSTARLTEALLRAAGRRTGLFTSPHLVHVAERVTIAGARLPEPEFAAAVEALRPVLDRVAAEVSFGPSRFEAFTALALQLFSEQKVDARIIEVGIGGRLDTTNVIDAEVAVLTNIDLDHVEYLGTTRAEIAADKAGIIKPESTAVTGPMPAPLLSIVARRCTDVGARLWSEGHDFSIVDSRSRTATIRTPGRTYRDLDIPFRGAHQAHNAACALTAAEAFLGEPLPEETVRAAWAGAVNPGRFEVISGERTVVIDVAHNPHGMHALAEEYGAEFGARPATVVAGINPHKDAAGMLEILRPLTARLIATQATGAPSLPAGELAELARAAGIADVQAIPDPAAAVAAALIPDGVVVCTGSHYWIGQVYEQLSRAGSRAR